MRHRVILCAVLATVLSGGAGLTAPEEPPVPRTLLQHLDVEMERVRLQLVNAGARLKGGAVSMGALKGDEPATLARRCCEQNIVRLEQHFRELSAIWGELRNCYRAEDNVEAEIQANLVREDAASLLRALGVFAASDESAYGGHAAMVKGFRLLNESIEPLPECGDARVRPPRQ